MEKVPYVISYDAVIVENKFKNIIIIIIIKGAFGAAILYRKKDDGLMVIIKVSKKFKPSRSEIKFVLPRK